jgi:hypothetical protein
MDMNDLGRFARVFDGITAWSGETPAGHVADFLGVVSPEEFLTRDSLASLAERPDPFRPGLPTLGGGRNCEFWFEAADWVIAAREARDQFVMATLGAFYGYQAIGSFRALTLLNPMPYRLIGVEPLAEKIAGVRRHMRLNGIDPDRQWLIQAAVTADNEPALFPVGAPRSPGITASRRTVRRSARTICAPSWRKGVPRRRWRICSCATQPASRSGSAPATASPPRSNT